MNTGVEVQGRSSARSGALSSQELWRVGSATVFALLWTGAIAATGLLLGFAALLVRARLLVGEWPHPRSGDPFHGNMVETSIDPGVFDFHSATIWYTSLALSLLVPVATFVLLVSAFVPRLRQRPWLYAAFLVPNAIIGALVILDPHGFCLWFID